MLYAITLDVGGSSVKSGIVTPDGQIVGNTRITPIDSSASADTILNAFGAIINNHIDQHGLDNLAGVALGFPGPFDYEAGISGITGQEKYEGVIRGMNVEPRFEKSIQPVTNPQQLSSFTKYRTPPNSPFHSHGLSLKADLGIEIGSYDFNQNSIPPNGIGASF